MTRPGTRHRFPALSPEAGRVALVLALIALAAAAPEPATASSSAAAIAAGGNHTCALITPPAIRCWGRNDYGQLGNGSNSFSIQAPVTVKALAGSPVQVSSGWEHTCAITVTGGARAIECWGSNSSGQIGGGTANWGSSRPVTVKGLGGVPIEVAAGGSHTCAIVEAGSVRSVQCWGSNDFLQLGSIRPDSPSPVTVTGLVGTPVKLSAGDTHTCVVATSGATASVRCWGGNDSGQLGNGTADDSATPVAVKGVTGVPTTVTAGWRHSCALFGSGASATARCWGANSSGQLGDGTTKSSRLPVAVKGLTGAPVSIAAGGSSTCAVVATSPAASAACWGGNLLGQLGNGSTTVSTKPVAAGPLSGAVGSIVAGRSHVCALVAGSSVSCWGGNDGDQLGGASPSTCAESATRCATRPIAVDLDGSLPPTPVLSGAPPAVIGYRQVTLQFTTSPGTTAKCSIDDSNPSPCTSPTTLGPLADGPHSFSVVAVKSDGTASFPVTATWEVDATAPQPPAFATRPAELANSSTAAFSLELESGATASCRIDNSDWTPCTASPSFSGLTDGPHSLEVTQTDVAGNVSEVATATWTIDTVAPGQPSILDTPPAISGSRSAQFAVGVDPGATLSCRLDLQPWGPCSTAPSFDNLKDGSHIAKFKQTDAAGNTGEFSTFSWTVDTVAPPTPTFSARPGSLTNASRVFFAFTKESAGAAVSCSLDDAEFAPCGEGRFTTPALLDGVHSMRVKASDPAGNEAIARHQWTLDTLPPAFSGPVRATKSGRNLVVTSRFDPALGRPAQLEFSTLRTVSDTSAPNARQTVSWATSVTLANRTSITWVRLKDPAGNWSAWVKPG